MENIEEPIICIREVNENIRRCEEGLPLTKPLAILNKNCEFRKKFEELDKIYHHNEILQERKNSPQKEIAKRWREKNKELIRLKQKYYYSLPKNKEKYRAYQREYSKRPEVILRSRLHSKKYYWKHKEELRTKSSTYHKEKYKKQMALYEQVKKELGLK